MSTLYVESAALAAEVRVLLSPVARRDQDLARRLRRACDDVPMHVAEGMCHTGRARRLEYGAALGSAREALACERLDDRPERSSRKHGRCALHDE